MRAYGVQWLEGRKTRGRELRPTTRQQYRMLLDTHIYPTFGDERLDRITAEDVTRVAPTTSSIWVIAHTLMNERSHHGQGVLRVCAGASCRPERRRARGRARLSCCLRLRSCHLLGPEGP
ncbi:tyrosine-type recombinase/integrase [Nocardioides acrostichi]